MKMIYISNLVKTCENLYDLMEELRQHNSAPNSEEITQLEMLINMNTREIEDIFRRYKRGPEDLPTPSRRAFLWLQYLSEPAHLVEHMAALKFMYHLSSDMLFRQKMHHAARSGHLKIVFLNQSALYRVRQNKQGIELLVHEGFCQAPQDVLENILNAALVRKLSTRVYHIRQYANSESFQKVYSLLDGEKKKRHSQPLGQVYNLEQIYQQVNQEYFQGQLEKPGLVWSKVLTYRTFGHYNVQSDTVTVSRSLDNPNVPHYVVDYIMYHELLHKKLGIKTSGKRRLAHTTEFRTYEKSFKKFQDAKTFLEKLAKKLSPRRKRF
jgi:hypothetical protein